MEAIDKYKKLVEWFSDNCTSVMVALSGGVDSAVVALAAHRALASRSVALTADYRTLSEEEMESARNISREIGISQIVVNYNELDNKEFVKNDQLRCYHCRYELAKYLVREANKLNVTTIVDGTNLDDLREIRHGIRALRENGIRSPLVEVGITKEEVRIIARYHDLSIFDKPSNSCLASRIPQGLEITFEKLNRIEKSETAVKRIFNVRQVRVRDHDGLARIEVGPEEIDKLFDKSRLSLLDETLKKFGFKFVAIDARGYRSGSLVVF